MITGFEIRALARLRVYKLLSDLLAESEEELAESRDAEISLASCKNFPEELADFNDLHCSSITLDDLPDRLQALREENMILAERREYLAYLMRFMVDSNFDAINVK